MIERGAEGWLERGGVRLFRRRWRPAAAARAKLLVVHGFGEHSGRYEGLAAALVDLGLAVDAYDHRGHGRSSGQRGFIRRWSELRDDLDAMLAVTLEAGPEAPVFLLGHSLGGLIVLDFVLRRRPPLAGVVVSGAVLAPPGIPRWLVAVARLLSRVRPRFSLATPIDPEILSRDAEAVAAYRADPLVHARGTARLSTEMTRTVRWVNAHAAELDLPLLVLHGGADEVASPAASRAFFGRAASRVKEHHEYPGGRHEPFNDTNRDEVVADLGRWLEARLSDREGQETDGSRGQAREPGAARE